MRSFLQEWQTLIGSAIGGVFAVTTALIVAYSQRRREERRAAVALKDIFDRQLTAPDAAKADLLGEHDDDPEGEALDEPPFLHWAHFLQREGVDLSDRYEGHAAVISASDPTLTHSLGMFRYHVERAAEMADRSVEFQQEHGNESGDHFAVIALEHMLDAAEYASLASPALDSILASGLLPFGKRLIRRVRVKLGDVTGGRWPSIYPEDYRIWHRSDGAENQLSWRDEFGDEISEGVRDMMLEPPVTT